MEFELEKFPDSKSGAISNENIGDDTEKNLEITAITATDLQDEVISSIIIEEYRIKVSKRMKIDEYMDIFAGYTRSIFQDFECYLRTEFVLIEDDIRLVLDKYNTSFITYDKQPGIYTFKDVSGVLLRILQPENPGFSNATYFEIDHIIMKSKLVVMPDFKAKILDKDFLVLF